MFYEIGRTLTLTSRSKGLGVTSVYKMKMTNEVDAAFSLDATIAVWTSPWSLLSVRGSRRSLFEVDSWPTRMPKNKSRGYKSRELQQK